MMAEKDGGALVSAAYRDGDGVTFKINTQHTHGGTPVAPLGQQPQLNVPEKMSHPRHGDDTTVYVTILTTEARRHTLFSFLPRRTRKKRGCGATMRKARLPPKPAMRKPRLTPWCLIPFVNHPLQGLEQLLQKLAPEEFFFGSIKTN